MFLNYTSSGYLIIRPQDDVHQIVDAMLQTEYGEEFCVSPDFDPDFIARLMKAGFLAMSTKLTDSETEEPADFILLPKLHLIRSILFFDKLHIKKSVRRLLGRYELRFDADFDRIVGRCLQVHGDAWLTKPLVSAIKKIRHKKLHGICPVSFALYRDGQLVSGEFGVVAGRVYTSYSGYYDEKNSGTVQLILATHYLKEHGFDFFDLGMPLDYKKDIGAIDVSPAEFVAMFRAAQDAAQGQDAGP